eukprot:363917-Chlamydomonas_euryale.AAC.5
MGRGACIPFLCHPEEDSDRDLLHRRSLNGAGPGISDLSYEPMMDRDRGYKDAPWSGRGFREARASLPLHPPEIRPPISFHAASCQVCPVRVCQRAATLATGTCYACALTHSNVAIPPSTHSTVLVCDTKPMNRRVGKSPHATPLVRWNGQLGDHLNAGDSRVRDCRRAQPITGRQARHDVYLHSVCEAVIYVSAVMQEPGQIHGRKM